MTELSPDEAADLEPREEALVELLRTDYDATLRALSGFVTTGGQIRAIGTAAWAVVVSLAVNKDSAALCVLAAALVVVFAYADAYHAALYRRTLSRAIAIEELFDIWLNRLGIEADEPDAVEQARAGLEMHRFGVQKALRRPELKDLLDARPFAVFRGMYPVLLVTSLAAFVVLAFDCV